MQLSDAIQPPDEPCTDIRLPREFLTPPTDLVEPFETASPEEFGVGIIHETEYAGAVPEFRLIPELRAAAQRQNAYNILSSAAVAFHRAQHPSGGSSPQADVALGNALADLAVTGRKAYAHLRSAPLDESVLRQDVAAVLAHRGIQATPADVAAALKPALDRAFEVAWALRGPPAWRQSSRDALGWIAVSGEDDKPHRPVNVPTPWVKENVVPYEQYEIAVTVKGISLQTRFFIASPPGVNPATTGPASPRELPPDPVPVIPAGDRVLLFLHGHSSGAEEALAIIPKLHAAGLAKATSLSIISFDLPNNGYSESFDHTRIAPSSATTYPGGLFDHGPVTTPVLDFVEDFVVAFVDALDAVAPFKDRIAGVFGGSLGGNLGLRLGRRDLTNSPWLNAGIVSWDAASVWAPMIQDEIKRHAPGHCRTRWEAPETKISRADYFYEVYEAPALQISFLVTITILGTQPQMWYREGWEQCKTLHIEGSRIARREIYDANYRQWHWRLAGEQLIYSHIDHVDHEDANSPLRYTLNMVPQLLVAGAMDNYQGSNIYDATRQLAGRMTLTPGRSLFLLDTGHSVHAERPTLLAKEIVDFLLAPPSSMQITCIHRATAHSRISAVGGINRTLNIPFSMSADECILSIIEATPSS